MNNPQIPDLATREKSIASLRQTRREIAEFNRELAEIEAQLDRELYAQKLARIGKIAPIT
jgi:predicted phage-related endonuclease